MEVYGIPLALAASDVFILSAWQIEFLYVYVAVLLAFSVSICMLVKTPLAANANGVP